MSITPSADTAYKLSCFGPDGTTKSSAKVSVILPVKPVAPMAPKVKLSVRPDSILQGQTAKLTWTSQDAIGCDIQPDIGSVQLQGSMNIKPKADTDYALACTGPGGSASSTVFVSVIKPHHLSPVVMNPEKEETVNLLIEFDFNKSVIKPKFYRNLNAVGEFMQKYPAVSIRVEGHTDSVGGKAYNRKLSQRRAEAVKKYIVDKFGIDAKRIKAIGYGEAKPVASNKTAEGRYKNRRVQAYHAAAK